MSDTKVDRPMVMDFFIGLKECPSEWQPKESDLSTYHKLLIESMYAWKVSTLSGAVLIEHPSKGQHPGLRFEDITAHLMMQSMAYNDPEEIVGLIKTCRQYGNQAMKKICRFCVRSLNPGWDIVHEDLRVRYMPETLKDDSSAEFVGSLNSGECDAHCIDCRVARTIMVANNMETFVFGFKQIDRLRGFALRWKKRFWRARKKSNRYHRKMKLLDRTVKGVTKAKIELEKQNRELRDALKESIGSIELAPGITMSVRKATVTPIIGSPEATVKGIGKVKFDEFDDIKDPPDDEDIKKILERAEASGQQVITGSIKKDLTDEEVMKLKKEEEFLESLEKEDVTEGMYPEQKQDIEDAVSGHPDSRFPYLMGLDPAKGTPQREPEPPGEVAQQLIHEIEQAGDLPNPVDALKKLEEVGEKAVEFLESSMTAVTKEDETRETSMSVKIEDKTILMKSPEEEMKDDPFPPEIMEVLDVEDLRLPGHMGADEDDLLDQLEPSDMTPEQTRKAKEKRDKEYREM